MDEEHLREILDSPLEERPPSGRRRALSWLAGAGVALAVGAVLWLFFGPTEEGEEAPTSTAASAGASTAVSAGATTSVSAGATTAADAGATTSADAGATTAADAGATATLPGDIGCPGPRYLPGFAGMDGGAVMLFGTEPTPYLAGDLFDEVWAYEAAEGTWRQIDSSPRPQVRFDLSAVYDSGNGKVLLFGGGLDPCFTEGHPRPRSPSVLRRCYEVLGDTWLLDPVAGTWEQVQVLDGPGPRSSHAMAYDPGSGTVVLFGGVTLPESGNTLVNPQIPQYEEGLIYLADTWVFDTAARTWTEVTPEVSPGPRGAHTMAYDAESGRIVLWSGFRQSEDDPLLWVYDPAANTWAPLETAGGPEESWDGTLVDAPGRGMILFDGLGVAMTEIVEGVTSTEIGWRNLVWHLDLGTGEWSERDPPEWPLDFLGAVAQPGTVRILVWAGDVTMHYDPATGIWDRGSAPAGN